MQKSRPHRGTSRATKTCQRCEQTQVSKIVPFSSENEADCLYLHAVGEPGGEE